MTVIKPTTVVNQLTDIDGNAIKAENKEGFIDTSGKNDILFSEHVLPKGARHDQVAAYVNKLRMQVEHDSPGRDVLFVVFDTKNDEPERVGFFWADELKTKDPIGTGHKVKFQTPEGEERIGTIRATSGEIEFEKGFWDHVLDVISTIAGVALCVVGVWMTAEIGMLGFILFGWFPVVVAGAAAYGLYQEKIGVKENPSKLLPGLQPPKA